MPGHCNITACDTPVRVRYYEVDRQNVVHHSNYSRYFEMGRTELLRANGYDYKTLEDAGLILVVARLECRFRAPAHYDDELNIHTTTGKIDRVRLEHRYTITRICDNRIIADGRTELVHIDRDGRLQPLPELLSPAGE